MVLHLLYVQMDRWTAILICTPAEMLIHLQAGQCKNMNIKYLQTSTNWNEFNEYE